VREQRRYGVDDRGDHSGLERERDADANTDIDADTDA
jgi:hypothetical protein